MGKYTIIGNLGNGKYRVRQNIDVSHMVARQSALDGLIAEIVNIKLPAAETGINNAQANHDQKLSDLNAAIEHYRAVSASETATQAEKDAAMRTVRVAHQASLVSLGELTDAKRRKEELRLEKTGYEKEKEYLAARQPTEPVIDVWCADYSTTLTGEVGGIEIPPEQFATESTLPVIIRPGFSGTAGYQSARDGKINPTISMGPANDYFNRALLPGWQKWKPICRIGAITALSGDLCNVALDENLSSRQNLNVNQTATLTAVPIQYMTCHGAAFSVGDRVLVEFVNRDWTQPRVIGFESNPKQCPGGGGGPTVHYEWSWQYQLNPWSAVQTQTGDLPIGQHLHQTPPTPETTGYIYDHFVIEQYFNDHWQILFNEMQLFAIDEDNPGRGYLPANINTVSSYTLSWGDQNILNTGTPSVLDDVLEQDLIMHWTYPDSDPVTGSPITSRRRIHFATRATNHRWYS